MEKGLIFDLDGVIVDTAKYHYLAWKQLADILQINFTEKHNELLKGVSREESLNILLSLKKEINLSEEQKRKYCIEKNDIYLQYINKLTPEEILEGVQDFIFRQRNAGWKIILGSASKNAKLILEKLDLLQYFDIIVDGTMVKNAKPDPEVFVLGADLAGVKYKNCYVFEDSAAGIQAAKTAGMHTIGIGTPEVLGDAELVIDSFKNAEILLDRILRKN